MIQHINKQHLDFVDEVREAFEFNADLTTYRNEDDSLIALRFGLDKDCILVYELGGCIGNFVQQMNPSTARKVGYRDES